MNKTKLVAVLFAVLLLCASLAACSDASDDPVVGTWELTQLTSPASDEDISVDEFLKAANMDNQNTPNITFKADHTVSVDMFGSQGNGKWALEDGKYHVTDDTGSIVDFILKDDVLSVEQNGASLKFKKTRN